VGGRATLALEMSEYSENVNYPPCARNTGAWASCELPLFET